MTANLMRILSARTLPVLLIVILISCRQQQQQRAAQPAPAPQQPGIVTGKVVETINSGGYTYIKLQTSSGEQWAAVNEASVQKGATVNVASQMTLDNFESKTLNRKFDKIIFGTLAGTSAEPPMPPGHPKIGQELGDAAQHMQVSDAPASEKVPRAEGGSTVSELWAERNALKDKPVTVRGTVVKSLNGIMDRNWLHLRDGSGSSSTGDNDITVTTNDTAAVGDVVVVKGTLRINKDFGSGYHYGAIIEDARVVRDSTRS